MSYNKQQSAVQFLRDTLIKRFEESGHFISKYDYLLLDKAEEIEQRNLEKASKGKKMPANIQNMDCNSVAMSLGLQPDGSVILPDTEASKRYFERMKSDRTKLLLRF